MRAATAETRHYHALARALHWIMAAIIIAAIILVIFRDPIEDAVGWRTMGLHKSLGLLALGLGVGRLAWRMIKAPPPLDPATGRLAAAAAHGVHALLYVLMLGLPVLGYIISSAGPYPMAFFGIPVAKLPIDANSPLAHFAEPAHVYGGYVMAALVIGHVGAALYHHFVLRDSTLLRMTRGAPTT